jgi:predicted nucleic acid-binding protein
MTSPSLSSCMPRAEPYGSGEPLVFDTSAWNRQSHPSVLSRWLATEEADLLFICPVVTLELLAGARNEEKFATLDRTLAALPAAHVTRGVGATAIGVSRELRGERRLPAADYLIAAAAAERGAGVLHYDRHFDALCEALAIKSVWIAESGSID